MAYNTNTRLLLQFDGASATTDTSSFARACSKTSYATINTGVSPHGTGGSLYCNGKASSGNIGKVSVTAPGDLFSYSPLSPWLFSLQYFIEATQDDYINGLLYFSMDDEMGGPTVKVQVEVDYEGTVIFTNGTYWLTSDTDAANAYGTGWHHLYVYFNGNTVKIGRDGNEVASFTLESSVLVDGYVTEMIFGDADVIPHYGGLDYIQLLENDSTWTGGSYTVPGRPDDYSAALPDILGEWATVVADVTTACSAELQIVGEGSSFLDAVASMGAGTVDSATDITGVSVVVVDDVVSISSGELTCSGVGEVQLSDVAGTGVGELLLSAVGTATVGVLSSGQASLSLTGTGAASVDVISSGLAGILVHGAGVTTLTDVLSSGHANKAIFGEGASVVSMIGSGFGNVFIVGEGQTQLGDVKTYHTPGHDWHVSRFSVRTQRNEMRVKL